LATGPIGNSAPKVAATGAVDYYCDAADSSDNGMADSSADSDYIELDYMDYSASDASLDPGSNESNAAAQVYMQLSLAATSRDVQSTIADRRVQCAAMDGQTDIDRLRSANDGSVLRTSGQLIVRLKGLKGMTRPPAANPISPNSAVTVAAAKHMFHSVLGGTGGKGGVGSSQRPRQRLPPPQRWKKSAPSQLPSLPREV
jgi:hypothetical protein